MFLFWTDRFDAAGKESPFTSERLLRESFVLYLFLREHLHRNCPFLIDEVWQFATSLPGIPRNPRHLPPLLSDAETAYSLYSIVKDHYGKPYFIDPANLFIPKKLRKNPPQFSISHTGQIWGCVFSCQEVGFDLEKEGRGADWEKIAERYYTKEESEWAASQQDGQGYLKIWTRKEAYVKLSGRGLGQGLSSFSVLSQEKDEKFHYTDIDSSQLPFMGSICHHHKEKLSHIIRIPDEKPWDI